MFDGKSVFITGGTGSFGQAFIRHLLRLHKPRRSTVCAWVELKQYDMQQEFNGWETGYFYWECAGSGGDEHYTIWKGASVACQHRNPPSS